MTRKPKQAMLALALGVVLSMPGTAADPSRTSSGSTDPSSSSAAQTEASYQVRMSKLIGMDIDSPSGRKLGDVKDVIVDMNSGRVHYAILAFGGFLGVGDKLFAMPLSQVRPNKKGKLVLDVDKEQLKSAPAFESSRWPNWNTGPYRAEVDRRYGSAVDSNARLRRATEVLKAEVRDANRADIGDIEDMVVDLRNSRIHYVVVEFDRAWNPNNKLVALPMKALRDGATAPPARQDKDAASPPQNPPNVLSLEAPSGPTKGPASATIRPGGVQTRPPAIEPEKNAPVQRLERQTLPTMTSYADDEDLVFSGTREQLQNAPAFDKKSYPDLSDSKRRNDLDRRLANW